MATPLDKRRYVAFGILLLAALAVLYIEYAAARGTRDTRHRFGELPGAIGDWSKVEDVGFGDRIVQILGTSDVKGGAYRDREGRTLQLVIVHAVNNRSAFHPPEYCLTGGGLKIVEKRIGRSRFGSGGENNLEVNEMVLMADTGEKLFVWNWYAAGGAMTSNFYKQQLALFVRQLRTGTSDGAAINIYAPGTYRTAEEARSAAADFTRELIPFLQASL